MKKIFLPICFLIAAISLKAQDPIYVYVDEQVNNGDTLRTFYVEDNYCATLIDHWTQEYGTPQGAGSGNLLWTGVDIQGIGNNLKIKANDGAQIFDGQNWSHSTFLDAADMKAKLSHDPARARRMYITVMKGNNNFIKTEAREQQFISTAESVMLAE
ncbi:MAG: hypothetical protein Salg2KO_18740 [Salibacteraceae bacterium]